MVSVCDTGNDGHNNRQSDEDGNFSFLSFAEQPMHGTRESQRTISSDVNTCHPVSIIVLGDNKTHPELEAELPFQVSMY